MKKWFLLALLMLCALMAFSVAVAQEPAMPTFAWEHDGQYHWQLDDNGQVVNYSAHQVDDALICRGCGCEVLDWGDGTSEVTEYDAWGNILRYTYYGEDGEVYWQSVYALECDADGLPLRCLEYVDGVLVTDSVYKVNAEGEWVTVSVHWWSDDGSYGWHEFDELGYLTYEGCFEADGTLQLETIYAYAMAQDGWYYVCQEMTRYASGETFYDAYNWYGDVVRTVNTDSEGQVWEDSSYEYQYERGVMIWSGRYDAGRLARETYYDEYGMTLKELEYLEDGSTETYLYNEDGDPVSTTLCDAGGNVISVRTYEYEYDDEHGLLAARIYENDRLVEERTYRYYSDGSGFAGGTERTWYDDGNCLVIEYDEWFWTVSRTMYTADGSILWTEQDE